MSVGMRKGFRADAIDREETMRARAAYFACVSYLDEVIGDLLLRLEADGLLENTVVVYSSDHGEMAGEHGVWWKNGWYEACTRVPLIFSLPEQRARRQEAAVLRTPSGLLDLFPTFCGLGGAPIPEGLDGVDLSGCLRAGSEPPDRPIVCDALVPRWGEGTEFRMIRRGRYKYVRFRDAAPLAFDLEDDPGEQRNLLQHGQDAETGKALAELSALAGESMDFDAAERERVDRDGPLAERYQLDLPDSTGNLYLFPSGKLVSAEDTLYRPTVIAEDAAEAFAGGPAEAGEEDEDGP
jgi:choline-sulfatase